MVRRYRKPYRIKKRRSALKSSLKFFKSRFFWLFVSILFFFGAVSYFSVFASFFQIKEIQISGNQKIQTGDVKDFIDQKINKKVIVPTKSTFLINLKKINNSFTENFPQAKEIKIKRKFPSTLIAQVQERSGIGVWCQEVHLNNEDKIPIERCFFIDETGVIFEELYSGKENYRLKIRSKDGEEIKLGDKKVESDQIALILKIQENLTNDLKIVNTEFSLEGENRINVKTPEGWEIYFNSKEDLNWQITKLKEALDKEVTQERRSSLEYIDVRFGNFAPFKYKGKVLQPSEVQPAP